MNRGFLKSGMTDFDICQNYRYARDKKKQIEILCDLTMLSENEIILILLEGNVLLKDKEKVEKMYNGGATDSEICKETGSSSASVFAWRQARNLPKNEKQKDEAGKLDGFNVYSPEQKKVLREKDVYGPPKDNGHKTLRDGFRTVNPEETKKTNMIEDLPPKKEEFVPEEGGGVKIAPTEEIEETAETEQRIREVEEEGRETETEEEVEDKIKAAERAEQASRQERATARLNLLNNFMRDIPDPPTFEITMINGDYFKLAKKTLEILRLLWEAFPAELQLNTTLKEK